MGHIRERTASTACPPHPTPGMGLRSPATAREVAEGQEMWGGSPGKEGRGQEAVTCCSAPRPAGCCHPAGFSAAPAPPSRAPSAAWCWPPRPTGGRWPRESTTFWGAPQKSHRHAENCPTLQTPRLCASHSPGRVPRMGCWCRAQHGTPPGPPAHLEDVVEVLLVHPQEVAVVLPQDDAGRPGRVVHQRQLPKIVPLVQGGHQTLRGDRDGVKTPVPCSGWGMQGVWRAPRLGTRWYRGQGGRAGTHPPCRG